MPEERWQHLVVRVDKQPQEQLTLVPSQSDLQTSTFVASTTNVVAMLNELGGKGWQLVAVRDNEYWLKCLKPATDPRHGEAFLESMRRQTGDRP